MFFEDANILRLHMTFSRKVGGAHPPPSPQAPTALLLDKSIYHSMIVKDDMVKVE